MAGLLAHLSLNPSLSRNSLEPLPSQMPMFLALSRLAFVDLCRVIVVGTPSTCSMESQSVVHGGTYGRQRMERIGEHGLHLRSANDSAHNLIHPPLHKQLKPYPLMNQSSSSATPLQNTLLLVSSGNTLSRRLKRSCAPNLTKTNGILSQLNDLGRL